MTARLARRSDSRTRAENRKHEGVAAGELQGIRGLPEGSWPVNAPAGDVASDLHNMPMLTASGADSNCSA